ncbi:MAG: M14 metallopeptidase family protein [Bacteroidota bacterium]
MVKFLYSLFFSLLLFHSTVGQQAPAEYFSFEPGSDYKLANYKMLKDYYQQLASSSDRVVYEEIGESVLGRPLILLIISSKANLDRIDELKKIAREQALAKVNQKQSILNTKSGKAVVWIDAGLHASERATAQMMPLLTYHLATAEDMETKSIRDNVVSLIMPVMNPDGLDIIVDWYQKNRGTPYETTSPPWLYHHYIGHDNNRDWFMNNMPETKAVNKVLYQEWFPQIVYNQHQTSPSWARMFVPPFANPVNPNIAPAVVSGTNLVGTAIANRLALKNMPGVISHYRFSMWWNGGMRTVPYFHNMIGILTETAHATPTPRRYPKDSKPKTIGGEVPSDGSAIFYPDPWEGGESKFRDAVDYMYEASLAVLKLAADRKSQYLSDIYTLGKQAAKKSAANFYGYLLSSDQTESQEVLELIDLLLYGGVEIHRLTEEYQYNDKTFPAGSFLVPANQAFINYAIDLMEKQSYPIQRKYPKGPLKTPYDLAGWTLPMQMGVSFEKLPVNSSPKSTVITSTSTAKAVIRGNGQWVSFSPENNASYRLVNQLLHQSVEVLFDETTGDLVPGLGAFASPCWQKSLL